MPAIPNTPSDSSSYGQDLPEKNFGLTLVSFNKLVEQLKEGDETLFERIYLSQFSHCQKKLMDFDRLTEREAYDATMETIIHFRDLLLRGKLAYGNLRFLFVRIARQRYALTRKKIEKVRELTYAEMGIANRTDYCYSEATFQTMERSFSQLGTECRQLLHAFYFNSRSLKEIARDENKNYPALRKQKSRCIQRMRLMCSIK
jgi:DNA-directed RNA polymerase specialized sigma24 family protein